MDVRNTAIRNIARKVAIITERIGITKSGANSKIGLTIKEEQRLFVLNADVGSITPSKVQFETRITFFGILSWSRVHKQIINHYQVE